MQAVNPPETLLALARTAAGGQGLDPALVCAVIEQESRWNPWAINPEPRYGYLWNVAKNVPYRISEGAASTLLTPPTDFPGLPGEDRDAELWGQKMSWGLLQVMGAVGRERGFRGVFLSELCDPATGLEFGCRHLAQLLQHTGGQVEEALLHWNGGGNPNYAQEVLARLAGYAPSPKRL